MNLLFLTPQLPYPPRQGTAIRNWGLIQRLSRAHAVTLLSFSDGEAMPVPAALRDACRAVRTVPAPRRTRAARLRTLLAGEADLARRLWSPAYAAALSETLAAGSFDIVQVEGLELAVYLRQARAVAGGTCVVYDAHNAEHALQRRLAALDRARPRRWPAVLYSSIQAGRLTRLEAEVCRLAHAVTCVSGADAALLRSLVPRLQPVVVPNGIDLDAYDPARLAAEPLPANSPPPGEWVVFSGKMDYRPNAEAVLWFAREAWPRVRAARPSAQFVVVGQQPAPSVARLHGRDGIFVTGAVPDARPYLARAAVYVAPLLSGGGTRFKLLEAMALARPVVSTTLGAEGFDVQTGRELILADSAADLAGAISTLLADRTYAAALGQAGRAFVRAYAWDNIVPRLEEVYTSLARSRTA